jgi:type IV pilus assembly protein PilC
MAVFAYEGKTRQGETKKGTIEAPNQAVAMARLRQLQIVPKKVKEKGKGMGKEISIPGLQQKVTEKDIVIFTRQFATMIDAGLPLVQCLEILGSQSANPTFKKVIFDVKETVEAGSTFADAIKRHPKVFDELYVNLIAAGEVGGILDTILNRLAMYIEKAMKLKKKVKGAMVYPGVIVTVAVGVVTILMVWVIPIFAQMFSDMGGTLPVPTQIVMGISDWLVSHLFYLAAGLVGFIVGFNAFYRWPKGRVVFDNFILKIPVIGDLIRKISVARFTRTLGTMISSGVPILEALNICAKTSGNRTVEAAIMKVRTSISEGKSIAQPLQETNVFPNMVVQMIGVGESTGALDTMLNKIADFYDDEVDAAVEALTALMEPALMVFLGIVIGGLVISMYLPIFTMAANIN